MAGYVLGTSSGVLAAAAVYYTLSVSLAQSTSTLRSDLHQTSQILSTSLDPKPLPALSSLIGPKPPNRNNPPFSTTLRQRWNLAISRAFDQVHETDLGSFGTRAWESGKGFAERAGFGSEELKGAGDDALIKTFELGRDVRGEFHRVGERVKEGAEILGRQVSEGGLEFAHGVKEGANILASSISNDTSNLVANAADIGQRMRDRTTTSGSAIAGDARILSEEVKRGAGKVEEEVELFERKVERGYDLRDKREEVVLEGRSFTGGSEGEVKGARKVEREAEGRLV